MKSCLEKAVDSLMKHNHCEILTFNNLVKYGEVPTLQEARDSLYTGAYVKWTVDSDGVEFYEVCGIGFPVSYRVNLVAGVLLELLPKWEEL